MKPLKIVFANMLYDYGDPSRGYGLEMVLYDQLHRMGHLLVPFHYDVLLQQFGREKMNAMLLELVRKEKPDALFTILSENQLDPATMDEISHRTDTLTFNLCADDHWRLNYTLGWAPHFNWMVTTSADAVPLYRQNGYSNVIHSQWGHNTAIHKKVETEKRYDVSFVGMPHGNRVEILQHLVNAGLRVHVWGNGWSTGKVALEEMVSIFNQTKINLNLSRCSSADLLQIKARDFEVPACGGFLMTGYNPELRAYYEFGREIETYRDAEELISKINYYLIHEEERERIAAAGCKRAREKHSYVQRFENIFKQMGLTD
ncbi:glycosyltransferase [Paenibacillus alkaliterrae]|uniref:CgeB family protein n=1 Tax=Paenibacillus alkaliterrae TaxID=320909 RepID=UPI001F40A9B7|nr:glycosyltransferase [Paenibacillus alkaliterrae]MCF2940167.1 glycosyltransferase [Paenibacillus alkaliterrae]